MTEQPEDFQGQPNAPSSQNPRWMMPVLGPFNALQIAAVLIATLVTAGALVFASLPMARPPQLSQTSPGAGFVALGESTQGLHIGDIAPEFESVVNGETVGLTDLDGTPLRLAALRGGPVWINFFATWCPPCQQETPVLRDLYEKYAPAGLSLVAISVQDATIDDVRTFVQDYGLGYSVGFDGTSAIFRSYQIFGLPTHFFLDRNGVIRKIVLGPVNREQTEQIISDLLNAESALPTVGAQVTPGPSL